MSTRRLRALVCAAALSALPVLVLTGGGTADAGPLPAVAATSTPGATPAPSSPGATANPGADPSPSPSRPAVVPTIMPVSPSPSASPSAAGPASPTPTSVASAAPSPTRKAFTRTPTRSPSPLPRVTSLAPTAAPTVIIEQPLATLAPATADPSPTPVAAVKRTAPSDPVTRLIVYVVVGGIVLAGAGVGGLYLTRLRP